MFTGSKRRSQRQVGFAVGFAGQMLCFMYALATKQYGFTISAIVCGMMYACNVYRTRKVQAQRVFCFARMLPITTMAVRENEVTDPYLSCRSYKSRNER